MCGRTGCTFGRDAISRACGYKSTEGKYKMVQWVKSTVTYHPSANLGPRDILPCVINGSIFQSDEPRVLCEMMWGMIPPWHIGDYRKHTMATHNGRLENLKTSKLYGPPLIKGQRCTIICEGFYEWKAGKTKKDGKQPYYIYASQNEGIKADDPTTWQNEWSDETGWHGFKPLKMAGIFDTHKTTEDEIVYSCTVITKSANNILSWLHDRSPVFLSTETAENIWLNENTSVNEAIDLLHKLSLTEGVLNWHPVSTLVNNVLNKTDDCRKEVKIKEVKRSGPTGLMASWLQKGVAQATKRKSMNSGDEKDNPKSDTKSPKIG